MIIFLRTTAILSTILMGGSGFASDYFHLSDQPEEAVSAPTQDCYEALTSNYSRNTFNTILPIDEIYDGVLWEQLDDGLTTAASKLVIEQIGENLKCDLETLRLKEENSGCGKIVPGVYFSHACYINSGIGYFVLQATLTDEVSLTFTRWD